MVFGLIVGLTTRPSALTALEANPDVDLILLDLNIGDSSGLATLQRVSAWKERLGARREAPLSV